MDVQSLVDLCTIQLALIGISFSIFTFLLSLIIGKFEVLNNIATQIKQGNHSPELKQTEHFCIKNIRQLKKMCLCSVIVCSVSTVLTILLYIVKSFTIPNVLYVVLVGVNILEIIGVLILMIIVFYSYFRNTRLD